MISEEEEKIIQEWIDKDISELALHYSGSNLRIPFLADQIKGRRKINEKFPFLKNHKGFIFPPYLSVEQSSSQYTAYVKSLLIKGSNILDMTGGMGIDAYFLSKENESYTLLEKNPELVKINKENFSSFGFENVEIIEGDSVAFLKSASQKYDVIYIDPARRSLDGNNRKVFLLEDLRPNVLNISDDMWNKTEDIWIKLSPLIDISYLCSTLRNLREIIVVSVKNEVKEVLVHLEKELEDGLKPERIALSIDTSFNTSIVSDSLYEPTRIDTYYPFEQYIYEPSKAIIKAGLSDKAAESCEIKKMKSNTFFYSLNRQVSNWDGRIFKIDRILSAQVKRFKKDFPYKKANIISRNHPMTSKIIEKKFGLIQGGDRYILAFSDASGNHIVSAKRIQ